MKKHFTKYFNLRILMFFGVTLFCFDSSLFSQIIQTDSHNQHSTSTKRFLYDLKLFEQGEVFSDEFIESYALIPRGNIYLVGVMLLVDEKVFDSRVLANFGINNYSRIGSIYAMRVPVLEVNKLRNIAGVRLVDIGDPVSPFLEHSVKNIRADSVYAGHGGLVKGYTGKGVVIAVIDWGFDYTHPVFWDTSLNHYRVVRAWDQNKLSGPAPMGYDFGTEYAGMDELLSAKEDTLYTFGPGSHGTHVAGIAGGAGAGTVHRGVAFESDLIFISLRRDAPSLIDAFTYVRDYAASQNKPFVVNMSFGSHLGPHDGSSLKNLGIDMLAGKGKIFVGSAGNNGEAPFHLKHDFTGLADTLKTIVNFSAHPEYFGQTLSMWGSKNSSFGVKLSLVDGNNIKVFETPYYFSSLSPVQNDTFVIGSDTLLIRITATSSFETNQKPNIRLEVRKTTPMRVLLEATSEDAVLHIWNNVRLNRRYTNWGVRLASNYPGAKEGDTDYGLGEPGGVGKSVITVASHFAERIVPSGQLAFGNLSSFTSRGPTVDERRKPDISGPGHNVTSAVNNFDPNPGTVVQRVNFMGKDFPFATYSGTSMSGPAVAGIVALLLQKNPTLNHHQVKEILIKTRRLDQHTGEIGDTAHLAWGHGKVNAFHAMLASDFYPVLPIVEPKKALVFPNPSSNEVIVKAPSYFEAVLCDMTGKIIDKIEIDTYSKQATYDVSSLQSGVYYFYFVNENAKTVVKFIKQ